MGTSATGRPGGSPRRGPGDPRRLERARRPVRRPADPAPEDRLHHPRVRSRRERRARRQAGSRRAVPEGRLDEKPRQASLLGLLRPRRDDDRLGPCYLPGTLLASGREIGGAIGACEWYQCPAAGSRQRDSRNSIEPPQPVDSPRPLQMQGAQCGVRLPGHARRKARNRFCYFSDRNRSGVPVTAASTSRSHTCPMVRAIGAICFST